MQKPNQRNHHDHCNPKKHDPAVVMQVPVKESPIHTGSKFGDHKDAQAISGRYKSFRKIQTVQEVEPRDPPHK
jgi:hypothetical protein